jgi:hypothetical protein
MTWTNHDAVHRHACHALEDFSELRRRRDDEKLWHSLSHHLRHVVFRSGHGVEHPRLDHVRRSHVASRHK